MKKLKEFFADMSETVTVTKLDGTLMVIIATLVGIIAGMLISPRKSVRLGCGNGSGNETTHNWSDDEDVWDAYDACDAWDEDTAEKEEEPGCLSFK